MQNLEIRKDILAEIFSDFTYNENKREFITWCTLGCKGNHHKKKLQINIKKNIYNCWVCGSSGFIVKLLNKEATRKQKNKYLKTIDDLIFQGEEVEDEKIDYPDGFIFLLDALDNELAENSYFWLKEKTGITDQDIIVQKIGFCTYGDYRNRLIFPSYSLNGSLNFYNSRAIYRTDSWKYLNSKGSIKDIIFNEILINWNEPIILVEGIKSYLRHLKIDNVVPIFGTRFNKNYKLFKSIVQKQVPMVYLALDYEAEAKSYKIMEDFKYYGIETKIIDLSDVKQPDEIDSSEFIKRILNAKKYSRKDYFKARIQDIRNNL